MSSSIRTRVIYAYRSSNNMPPTKIKAVQIDIDDLIHALPITGITSSEAGGYKKITEMRYNPATGDLLILYLD